MGPGLTNSPRHSLERISPAARYYARRSSAGVPRYWAPSAWGKAARRRSRPVVVAGAPVVAVVVRGGLVVPVARPRTPRTQTLLAGWVLAMATAPI